MEDINGKDDECESTQQYILTLIDDISENVFETLNSRIDLIWQKKLAQLENMFVRAFGFMSLISKYIFVFGSIIEIILQKIVCGCPLQIILIKIRQLKLVKMMIKVLWSKLVQLWIMCCQLHLELLRAKLQFLSQQLEQVTELNVSTKAVNGLQLHLVDMRSLFISRLRVKVQLLQASCGGDCRLKKHFSPDQILCLI